MMNRDFEDYEGRAISGVAPSVLSPSLSLSFSFSQAQRADTFVP